MRDKIMKPGDVFIRTVDLKSLENKQTSDFTIEELVAYLLSKYPNDPLGALSIMSNNLEVGSVLSSRAKIILERIGYDKRS